MRFGWPSGDDLAITLFFAACGVASMIASVQEGGFKRWSLAVAGGICFYCALFWPYLKGWFPVLAAGFGQVASNPILWFCSIVLCLAWWVGRRRPPKSAHPEIDRAALAEEAMKLSKNIGALSGESAGRIAVAWDADAHNAIASGGPPSRDRSIEAKARIMEKYGESYHADVWRVISLSQKCISLDKGDLWRISDGGDFNDISFVSVLLANISTKLKYPQPNFPLSEKTFINTKS